MAKDIKKNLAKRLAKIITNGVKSRRIRIRYRWHQVEGKGFEISDQYWKRLEEEGFPVNVMRFMHFYQMTDGNLIYVFSHTVLSGNPVLLVDRNMVCYEYDPSDCTYLVIVQWYAIEQFMGRRY